MIATTNRKEKLRLLSDADETVLDNSILRGVVTVDKALEPVRPYTPKDILRLIGPNGMVCDTVILGREYILDRFDPIKEIPNGVYLTGFYSNSPHPGDILSFLDAHGLRPGIGVRFWFSDIGEACTALDGGRVDGKIVVVMDRWTTWTSRGAE